MSLQDLDTGRGVTHATPTQSSLLGSAGLDQTRIQSSQEDHKAVLDGNMQSVNSYASMSAPPNRSNSPVRRSLPADGTYPMSLSKINEASLANAVGQSRARSAKSLAPHHYAAASAGDENFPKLGSATRANQQHSESVKSGLKKVNGQSGMMKPRDQPGDPNDSNFSSGLENTQANHFNLPQRQKEKQSVVAGNTKSQKSKKKLFVNGQHLLGNTNDRNPPTQQRNVQNHPAIVPNGPRLTGRLSDGVAPGQFARPQYRDSHPMNNNLAYPMNHPPAQGRRLYDPRTDNRAHLAHFENIVAKTIEDTAIDLEEAEEKEQLRVQMEELCRASVLEHETLADPMFPAKSVELVRFGSLATTFATKNSDMDLVLLSPRSKVDAGSIESPLPRLIEGAFLGKQWGARLLTRTRVPIIKFCEKPTPDLLQRLVDARNKWELAENGSMPDGAVTNKNTQSEKPEETEASPAAQTAIPSQDGSPKVVKAEITTLLNAETSIATKPTTSQNELRASKPNSMADLGVERDDTNLATKSDEERVRLYRLAMKEGWYSSQDRQIISSFLMHHEACSREASPDHIHNLNKSRDRLSNLPNVLQRYREPTLRSLEFPKSGVGVQCDINFSNHLGIYNSQLLRCYSKCDPRVREMVLFIKAWAKKRRINSGYEGTLSSYGYVLLVLHYLMNIASPHVIPNLQHDFLSEIPNHWHGHIEVDGHVVHFYRDEDAISQFAQQGRLTQNRSSIGMLLAGFFNYYGSSTGHPTFHWMKDCVSIRTRGGIIRKDEKGWVAAKTEHQATSNNETKEVRQRYLVALEDPFELSHNVGRTVSHDGICSIRDEFRRAHRLINLGGGGGHANESEDLMEEVTERATLQHKYFGPNFRARGGYAAKKQPDIKNASSHADKKKEQEDTPPAPADEEREDANQPRVSLPPPSDHQQPKASPSSLPRPSPSQHSYHHHSLGFHPGDLPIHDPFYDKPPHLPPHRLHLYPPTVRSLIPPPPVSPPSSQSIFPYQPYYDYPPASNPNFHNYPPRVRLPPPPPRTGYPAQPHMSPPMQEEWNHCRAHNSSVSEETLYANHLHRMGSAQAQRHFAPSTSGRGSGMVAEDMDPAIISMGGARRA